MNGRNHELQAFSQLIVDLTNFVWIWKQLLFILRFGKIQRWNLDRHIERGNSWILTETRFQLHSLVPASRNNIHDLCLWSISTEDHLMEIILKSSRYSGEEVVTNVRKFISGTARSLWYTAELNRELLFWLGLILIDYLNPVSSQMGSFFIIKVLFALT